MKSFQVVSVGNAIIDLFLAIHDANISCRLNKKECELCVKFGEKIELDRYEVMIGGNATNAAVGLSRAGFSVSLVAEVGDDEFAHKIHKTLEEEKVDTSQLVLQKGAPSSMTVGINFQKERTLFVGHMVRKHDFVFDNLKTEWVYLTSLGNEWKDAYKKTIAYVKKTGAKLAFNPGTLQIEAGYDTIAEALSQTEVLFINKEEAEKILTIKNSPKDLLIAFKKKGPKNIVITDGEKGSYAIDEKGDVGFLTVFPTTVIEKTGAGDAYASGFLSGFLDGADVPQSMRFGAANASHVIQQIGAQRGLLHKKDMQEILDKNKTIRATRI